MRRPIVATVAVLALLLVAQSPASASIAVRCDNGAQLVPGYAVAYSKSIVAVPRGWGSANQGAIDVAVEGSDAQLYVAVLRVNAIQGSREKYDAWDGSNGQATWYPLGGQIQGPPLMYSGTSPEGTYLIVYVHGKYDGAVYRNVDAYGNGWSGWQYVGPGNGQNYQQNFGAAQLDSRRYYLSSDINEWWRPKVECVAF